ncbi:MAG TPA: SDR family oxidoreductase [Pseudonocardia sp.]|jgi:3-oxoacyl-[acyl-carrier protein] reductase|uniref:SDR family NAD(P)-dependent oxidoreductase n=1 Tax=Pseudonocardia sp. TaxID=60912 RepID=UPI002F42045D
MTRTVVVTGGGTGIGRAVAACFAHHGDAVVITGRRGETLRSVAAELGQGVRASVCDGTDPDQVAEFAGGLESVDVLVNCAGGNTDWDRPEPADLRALAASWRANLEANLTTAVLMTEALRDRLAPGGTVVNIGSIAADKGAGSYGASKAALNSWNVELAGRLGPRGVTANVVSPGYIADTEFFRDRLSEQREKALVAATSTGRAGTPADVAGTIEFLASGAARHITGQVIAVNGGALTTR